MGNDFLLAPPLLDRILCRIADESARVVHLVHDLVTRIDTGRAADALVLQAIADIDAGRANLDANTTIDAVPLGKGLWIHALLACTTRLSTSLIVGDRQRIRIEHHALEARIGTHVLANLLPHDPREEICKTAVEEDPEDLPGAEAQGRNRSEQFLERTEIGHKGEAGPEGNRNPRGVFCRLDTELAWRHRRLVQFHALVAITLDLLLDPHENLGIHRLRTRIAAPKPPSDGCEEEQGIGRDDQQDCEKENVLRPEDPAKYVELAFRKVKENGLATIPL